MIGSQEFIQLHNITSELETVVSELNSELFHARSEATHYRAELAKAQEALKIMEGYKQDAVYKGLHESSLQIIRQLRDDLVGVRWSRQEAEADLQKAIAKIRQIEGDAATSKGLQRKNLSQTEEINRLRRELKGLEQELKEVKKKGFAIPKRKIQIVTISHLAPDVYYMNQRARLDALWILPYPNRELEKVGLNYRIKVKHRTSEPIKQFVKPVHHQTFQAPYPSGPVCDYGYAKPFFAHYKVYKIQP